MVVDLPPRAFPAAPLHPAGAADCRGRASCRRRRGRRSPSTSRSRCCCWRSSECGTTWPTAAAIASSTRTACSCATREGTQIVALVRRARRAEYLPRDMARPERHRRRRACRSDRRSGRSGTWPAPAAASQGSSCSSRSTRRWSGSWRARGCSKRPFRFSLPRSCSISSSASTRHGTTPPARLPGLSEDIHERHRRGRRSGLVRRPGGHLRSVGWTAG